MARPKQDQDTKTFLSALPQTRSSGNGALRQPVGDGLKIVTGKLTQL
jgi:hypothetical protein